MGTLARAPATSSNTRPLAGKRFEYNLESLNSHGKYAEGQLGDGKSGKRMLDFLQTGCESRTAYGTKCTGASTLRYQSGHMRYLRISVQSQLPMQDLFPGKSKVEAAATVSSSAIRAALVEVPANAACKDCPVWKILDPRTSTTVGTSPSARKLLVPSPKFR
jgi:hypothetical protein